MIVISLLLLKYLYLDIHIYIKFECIQVKNKIIYNIWIENKYFN